MTCRHDFSRARGFTLIEMIVVVALLGILGSAARPVLELSVKRAKETALRQDLRVLREAIDAHRRAASEGRIAVAADASGYPPSLEVLVAGVPDAKQPKDKRVFFLRRMPRDPFADPAIPAAQTWDLRASDSSNESFAPGRDVFDVRSRSDRVAIDGTPYRDW